MKHGLILGATTLVLGLSVTWAAWDGTMRVSKTQLKKPAATETTNSRADSTAPYAGFTSFTSKPLAPVMQTQ